MLEEIESSAVHSDIVNRFQNLFPHVMVNTNSDKNSVFESIDVIFLLFQKLVRNLPVPSNYETMLTLSNMKNVVDGQELRIQLGMIDTEADNLCEMGSVYRKPSNKTQDGTWDENIAQDSEQWAWNQDSLRSQQLCNEFYSFLD